MRENELQCRISDTDVESTANYAPSNKKREPYFPRSEKTENDWRLPDEQQAYLQKFINSHYTDEELTNQNLLPPISPS